MAASLALGFPSFKSEAETPIRIGIIGTGDRGTGLLQLLAHIPGLSPVALCDLIDFRLDAALKIAHTQGANPRAYRDYRSLLDDRQVDAVLLCSPFGLHAEMALDVLDSGKHIFCEKTMVRGENAIQQVLAKAASHPELIFQTGHQYHSSALYRRVKEYVDQGYLGKLTAVHCQWHRNHNWRRHVPANRPELERLINWRMYKEWSGGLVAELMSHQMDFVNWISNSRPEHMSGQGGIDFWKDGRETFDNVHIQAQYLGGLDATFSCTTSNRFGDYEIRVHGSKATVVLGYEQGRIYHESTDPQALGLVDGVSGATLSAWAKGEGVPIDADGKDASSQALREFEQAIRNNRQPESNVHTGALAARCVDLGIRASEAQTTLHWGA